jgi:hypothetical protein
MATNRTPLGVFRTPESFASQEIYAAYRLGCCDALEGLIPYVTPGAIRETILVEEIQYREHELDWPTTKLTPGESDPRN